jgi:hypothetical protein
MPFLSPGMYSKHRGIDELQNVLILIEKPIRSEEINLPGNICRESLKLKSRQTRIANSDFFSIPEFQVPVWGA